MALNPLQADPTRTTTLRKQAVAEVNRRFASLSREIRKLIYDDDILGLRPSVSPWEPHTAKGPITNAKKAWQFKTDDAKLASFGSWIDTMADAEILGGLDRDGIPTDTWTSKYTESSYKKGIVRGYVDSHKDTLAAGADFYEGSKAEFLRGAFGAPETTSKVRLLATRSFNNMKGVSDQAKQQLNFILAQGIAQGDGADKIARAMTQKIGSLPKHRARTIARTEIIHAHAEGQLDSFERLGIEEVGVMAEWHTAGDSKVCPLCRPLEGVILTVQEARGGIPRHPNCRCAWIPANVGEKTDGQIWSAEINDQVRASLKAEAPKGLSAKEARANSVWSISKKGPISSKSKLKPTGKNLAALKAAKKAKFEAKKAELLPALEIEAEAKIKAAAAQKAKDAAFAAKKAAADKIAKEKLAAEIAAKKAAADEAFFAEQKAKFAAQKAAAEKAAKEAAIKAAAEAKAKAEAAAKLAHSQKVKKGMAQKHYAKDKFGGGVTDNDWTTTKKDKLSKSGLDKVLSEKGWYTGSVDVGTLDALEGAADVVEQKVLLDAMKKAPKGTPKPPIVGIPEPITAPPVTGPAPPANTIKPVAGAGWNEGATYAVDNSVSLGGSTGAKLTKATNGGSSSSTDWVMKQYSGRSLQAENEYLTNNLYNAVKARSAPASRLGRVATADGDGVAVFNRFIADITPLGELPAGAARTAAYKEAQEGFVMDAWLANWDAVGLSADNIALTNAGTVVRIDNGGALLFRAQGGLKGSKFGPDVFEFETLLDASLNPSAANLYSGIKPAQIAEQIDLLESAVSAQGGIAPFLRANGLDKISDPAAQVQIAQTLEKRYSFLLEKRDKITGTSRIPLGQRRQRLADVQVVKTNQKAATTKRTGAAAIGKDVQNMTAAQKAAVTEYTGGAYGNINEAHLAAVRKGKTSSAKVKLINEGLAKMTGFKGTVGRGHTTLAAKDWNAYKKGEWSQVWWTCPASSSCSPSSVFGSSGKNGVCFIIKTKGKRNGYARPISRHSSEDEALFMGDSSFRVVGWAESDVRLGGSHQRFLVMEEMDAGKALPETQVAPPELPAHELWGAFQNDAARAGFGGVGDTTGKTVDDILKQARKK